MLDLDYVIIGILLGSLGAVFYMIVSKGLL